MEIVHKWKGQRKEGSGSGSFLLSSNKNAFFADGIQSRYKGFYFSKELDWFKTIHAIKSREAKKVVNYFSHIEKISDIRESFFIPYKKRTLVYETNKETNTTIVLDCRKIFDNSDNGRIYFIEKKRNKLVITYEKKEGDKYVVYVVISGVSKFNLAEKWEKEFHEFDKRRNSLPWETYVYNLGNFVGTQLIITSSYDLEEALEENEFVKKNLGLLKREKMELIKKFKTDNVSCACATNSLQQLKGDVFYYAGFPWFLQYWSRDQLVSLGAIIQQHDFEAAKEIIFTYLKHITKDGRLPNRIPPADLQSADSIGWLWKRVEDFLIELKIKKLTEYYLDESDMGFLADRLEHCISLLEKNHCEQGLLFSRAKETWMDTTEQEGSDTRIGARIELQAMMSQMNKLAYFLTRNQIYQTKEIELRDKVRRLFFNGEILKDGAFDPTQRPNIFIAHYIYPELLSNDEWKIVFIKNLERTWLEWGGLASISKKHPLFQPAHTGENNRSYHRGDSWFWLNNLAAICLHRVDKKLFSGYIKKIKQASEQEILFHGFIGANAEISSASKLESFGCWNQFWSNAMFIELCNELK